MTPADVQALQTARKALTCLYLAVDEHVADDVNQKVEAAFSALLLDEQALEALRDEWRRLQRAHGDKTVAAVYELCADDLDVLLHGAGGLQHEPGCPAIADDESDYEHLADAGTCVCSLSKRKHQP